MKKLEFILMACALIIGTVQCKKNDETNKPENGDESIFITLDVSGGTRANVVPEDDIAPVYYVEGDMIHVVSAGKYIGTLTYNGSDFTGDITNPTEGQPLHFYFLGNVTPNESLVVGETSTCSVVISDQTTSHPVISYATSNQNYSEGTTNYTATLLNKCALVKFNVTTVSEAATCILGMNNKLTVDFSTNNFVYSQENEGIITLPIGGGEKWTILLPQDAVAEGEEGSVFSAGYGYVGIRPALPAIANNYYLSDGIDLTVNIVAIPPGAINGLFTINENGDQVYFAKGNLQFIGSVTPHYWKFAENQWEYFGATTGNNTWTENHDKDLFCWGTSNYNHGAHCYQPWTRGPIDWYNIYGDNSGKCNLFDYTGQADWGCNAIVNGGNIENQWRTLRIEEWFHLLNYRETLSGIRYARANVNGFNGLIILPDNWSASYYNLANVNNNNSSYGSNVISLASWMEMESMGAVFLPAAGTYYKNVQNPGVANVGSWGRYWSSSYKCPNQSSYPPINRAALLFCGPGGSGGGNGTGISNDFRNHGHSVRLVRDAE